MTTDDNILNNLSVLIKAKRRQRHLSLRDAAIYCHVSASTLSRLERHQVKSVPDTNTLMLLARWLDQSMSDLCGKWEEVEAPTVNTVDRIKHLIMSDTTLSTDTQLNIIAIIRVVFNHFVGKSD